MIDTGGCSTARANCTRRRERDIGQASGDAAVLKPADARTNRRLGRERRQRGPERFAAYNGVPAFERPRDRVETVQVTAVFQPPEGGEIQRRDVIEQQQIRRTGGPPPRPADPAPDATRSLIARCRWWRPEAFGPEPRRRSRRAAAFGLVAPGCCFGPLGAGRRPPGCFRGGASTGRSFRATGLAEGRIQRMSRRFGQRRPQGRLFDRLTPRISVAKLQQTGLRSHKNDAWALLPLPNR